MEERHRGDHRAEPQRRGRYGERVEHPPCVKRSTLRVVAVEIVIGAEQSRNGVPFASARERLPLRPAHALVSLDHQAEVDALNDGTARKTSPEAKRQ